MVTGTADSKQEGKITDFFNKKSGRMRKYKKRRKTNNDTNDEKNADHVECVEL